MKAKDIRKGTIIMFNGNPHTVHDFYHHTPGNKRAFVQAKLRNVMTGIQSDTKFSSTEDLEVADVYTFDATYLFKDSEGYHFMNSETYEEAVLPEELVGDNKFLLQDNMKVGLSTFNDQPIGIKLPKTVTLVVAETDPEMKGATATNVYKPATTDTGLQVTVPPFIKTGERIIIDTTEMKYLSRAE